MKNKLLIFLFFIISFTKTTAQEENKLHEKYSTHNKGKFFISWGGNRESFTKSDIRFQGEGYDFTVENAKAHDKPKGWHIDYINPVRMTIPQTNFRMGYFIQDKYSITLGVDHMKYIMTQDQTAKVSGYINAPLTQEGTYNNTPVDFTDESFLTFEHTNGLNYVHTEVSRFDDFSSFFKMGNTDKFQLNFTEGLGFGLLYPKTDAKVLDKERHDDFHVSGYGLSAKAGLNFTFYKYFYIQTELKGGYINMQDIQTTVSNSDSASQHFMFFEQMVSFGAIFKFSKND